MKKTPTLLFLFCLLFLSSPQAAEKQSSLNELKSKIKNVQIDLSAQQIKRKFYEKQLKKSELKANELAQQLQSTSHSLSQQKNNLAQLEMQTREYQAQLKTHEEALNQQLKATYTLSQESYLKLILNQENPESIGRNLQYYYYLHKNRMESIDELKALIEKVESNQTEIKTQSLHLADLKVQQQQEQLKLNILQQDRKQSILLINKDIKTTNQKLQDLLANKRRLENTLTNLNQRSTQYITNGKSFPALKGQLNWPTKGHIMQAYGSSIEHSELRANSVLIAAPAGQAVYAIAPGKVIFSKWMTGYGLLLIIDHGNHYLSLYGRNQNLFKKEGDLVKAGEEIATIGNSGGYQTPALYFALRHNAEPLNPSGWMRGKI